MAVAFDTVQASTWGSGTTATVTIAPASNSNRCLFAIVTMDNAGLTLSSITDDQGQTWTSVGSVTAGDRKVYIYRCVNPAATSTVVTFTFSGTKSGNTCGCTVISLYGVDQTTPADGFVSGTTGTTLNVTVGASDMTVLGIVSNASITVSATSPDTYTKASEVAVDHETGYGTTSDGTFGYSFNTSRAHAACNVRAAASSVTGSGALAAQSATVSGSGTSLSAGTGALSAQASAIAGAGISASVGSGALAAAASAVSGSGASLSTGTGALAAQAATIAGAGASSSAGTGALAAQPATVSGAGVSASSGTGSLTGQASSVAATGVSASVGSGALIASAAAVDGAGTAGNVVSGTGSLVAGAAQVAGVGTSASSGAGDLASQVAQVNGAGAVSGVVEQPETAGGGGRRATTWRPITQAPMLTVISGSGALVASAAQIKGSGAVSGLSTQDRKNRRTMALLMAA